MDGLLTEKLAQTRVLAKMLLMNEEERASLEPRMQQALEALDRVGPRTFGPFADADAAFAWIMRTMVPSSLILSRSRYSEELLDEAIGRGVSQYVILGAGLDTFALRRPELLERIHVFEVDQPATQSGKRRRMALTVRTVVVDLKSPDRAALGSAIQGADAVISALGPRSTAFDRNLRRGLAISRADVAHLMIRVLGSPRRSGAPSASPADGSDCHETSETTRERRQSGARAGSARHLHCRECDGLQCDRSPSRHHQYDVFIEEGRRPHRDHRGVGEPGGIRLRGAEAMGSEGRGRRLRRSSPTAIARPRMRPRRLRLAAAV